ncbi:13008_t:CDS:2 [Funneliformis geosporum]|nr:13008_t:CDS:2 [Funneliformis geosporum]
MKYLMNTFGIVWKNIITDFIGDKVLKQHLHYATSDLKKILRRFNNPLHYYYE